MVSRRNYFTIVIIMAIMFFLFQAVNAAKEHENDYKVNPFAQSDEKLPVKADAYKGNVISSDKDIAVYIGGNDPVGDTVTSWCLYSKRVLRTYSSLSEYEAACESSETEKQSDIMLINSEYLNWANDADTVKLCGYADNGTVIVFCNLPEASVVAHNHSLRELLGVSKAEAEETTVGGLHLFQGLLLGGETIYKAEDEEEAEKYQDMELTFPWYSLASGTKVYMKGIPTDETVDTEDYPPVIWRNSYGNSNVFAVNGSYIAGPEGIGILTGFMTEARPYEIYPVVNAQNMVIANYPGLADENTEEMQRRYSRSMSGLFRDVIWPSLESIYERNFFGFTCMIEPQFDYNDENPPMRSNLTYYLKSINEIKGEAGLSAVSLSETEIEQKLSDDADFFQNEIPEYKYTSLYVRDLDDSEIAEAIERSAFDSVRTVVASYNGESSLIGYQNDTVTRQSAVIDGFSHTYHEDLRVKSVESALGYTSILADMERVAYPETDSDSWEKLSKDFTAYTNTFWKSFKAFDGTTATECDKRIRSFLALDYKQSMKDNKITLEISGTSETSWFILRTHGQTVEKAEGGNFTEIEEDAYLIEAESSSVTIQLAPSDERYYYDKKEAKG